MASSIVQVRIDEELKSRASAIYEELGLDLTTAIKMFIKRSVSENGVPFSMRLDTPNATTIAAMEAAEKDEDMYGPFDSVAELMEALDA